LPAKFDDTSYNRLTFLTKLESNPRGGLVGLKYDNYNVKTALGQRFVFNAKRNGDSRSSKHYLSNTGFYQLSGSYFGLLKRNNNEWSLNASYFGQKLGILSSSHIGNLTDLNRALASDTPLIINPFTYEIGLPSQVIHHFTGKLKWKYASERIGELTASYTVQNNQRQEFDSHRGSKGAALDLNLWTQQLNLWVVKPINQFKLQYGAMGESQQNKFQGRYFIPNYLRYTSGAFAILTAEKSRSLVEAGLRYDYQYVSTFRYQKEILLNEKFNYSGLSANLSGWLKVNEDIKTYFSLSTRMRNPDINELYT
jgi:iron complex outermembrane receptor protein